MQSVPGCLLRVGTKIGLGGRQGLVVEHRLRLPYVITTLVEGQPGATADEMNSYTRRDRQPGGLRGSAAASPRSDTRNMKASLLL